MKLIKFWVIFLMFFISSDLIAQEKKIEPIQNLTIADGLAHNGVTSILKDSKGYIWIGTYDGLNRYDGYEFKVFKNTPNNQLFVSNRIRSLAEDSKSNLWLGTDEGISIYNRSTEQFRNLYSNKIEGITNTGPTVRHIFEDSKNGRIVCSTEGQGILLFDNNYKLLGKNIPKFSGPSQPVLFFYGMPLDSSNYVFSTSNGLYLFDIVKNEFSKALDIEIGQQNSFIKLDQKKFLLTLPSGLAIADFKKETKAFDIKRIESLSNYQLRNASTDSYGNLWLSTLNSGVIRIELKSLIEKAKVKITGKFKLSGGIFRASCILSDTNSGCWIGTFDKGIYRFRLSPNPFHSNPPAIFDFSVHSNRVTHISAFDSNRFFITTQFDGLAFFNTEKGKFEPVPENISQFNSKDLSAVIVDSRNDIWVNYNNNNGLCRIRKNSNQLEKIGNRFGLSDKLKSIRTFEEDYEGNLWIVDFNDVIKFNIDKEGNVASVESLTDNPYFKENPISLFRSLYRDSKYNLVWIGTSADGLFRLNLENSNSIVNAKIDRFTYDEKNNLSVSSNFISCISRLPNGELWLGTERGGICKVIDSNNIPEFVSYSEAQGLSNNVVKSIVYDNQNNLWVSTNNGLNIFDTSVMNFRIFKKANGLPFEDFYYSSEKLKNGNIVMSGLNGFCYFNPKEVEQDEVLPKLEFNNFKIFNRVIHPGDTVANRVILKSSITQTDEITLKHNENVFSLELTALHYSTPENHYLRYKLIPINEQWIEVPSSQRVINYNGLRPGEYELRVMASNSINEWTSPKTLKINIKPPFWLTIPAFLIYFLVIAIIIYSVMYYILRMNKLQHQYEIEHLEKENVKEVNAAKLRFFSNISHEIKTPLTLISGPINLMMERYRGSNELIDKLGIVQRQSKKISQLVDQVHDFQRADANKLKMNYSDFCFNDFLKETIVDFNFLANANTKQLEVIFPDSKIYVSADKDKLEKIINNILNNAFKYTKENDFIKIRFWVDDKNLKIDISDSGKGIAPDDLPHIFERFYQSKHKYAEYTGGSGIGLAFTKRLVEMHYGFISAESQLQQGTTFRIKLPVVIEKPLDELLGKEKEILKIEETFRDNAQEKENIDQSKFVVQGDSKDARIFYAEDNLEMNHFVSSVLSGFFNVKSFANGQELMSALQNEWPDLVISDVLMPELNGFEVCKQIKSDIKTSHIPVILLTACITIDEQLKGLRSGADAYIKKPFDVQHLITRVETLLQNRKLLRERFQIDFPLKFEKRDEGANDLSFLEKLYTLMEENLDNTDIDMDRLAKKLYLNRTHFYQKVKAITNQTPFELLKMYRLKRAAEILVQQQVSVNEVYVRTGFKSRSNFSKLFKEKYKITPGKYASEAIKKLT